MVLVSIFSSSLDVLPRHSALLCFCFFFVPFYFFYPQASFLPTLSRLDPRSMCVKEQSKWLPSTDDEGHLQRTPSSAVAFNALSPLHLPAFRHFAHEVHILTPLLRITQNKRNPINMADSLKLINLKWLTVAKKPHPFSISHIIVISLLRSIFTLERWGLAFWRGKWRMLWVH